MIQCVFVQFLAGAAAKSIDEMHINRNSGNKFSSTKLKSKKTHRNIVTAQPASSTISRLHTKWIHDEYGIYSYFTINKMQLLNFILVIGFACVLRLKIFCFLLSPCFLQATTIGISVAFVVFLHVYRISTLKLIYICNNFEFFVTLSITCSSVICLMTLFYSKHSENTIFLYTFHNCVHINISMDISQLFSHRKFVSNTATTRTIAATMKEMTIVVCYATTWCKQSSKACTSAKSRKKALFQYVL